ncbi:alanine racemase [Bradyrhizobium yuanmingense]|uniref:alanine racemase n=1 Tax=Bradyrhizobium TaxID=374 RepID=UPI001CD29952|nr:MULTISPECIES: alanine racemase [unclassified Bradyrhizobium]MCA1375490.1 alanine racemase [Bradyrhizobium sp. IC4060]MCA1485181.1 alanine racemase [Bradyrhizobium sp. IC4061]MCA1544278.1 alanine racemase [Bradyrhizobium sp. NBAIM32]UWU88549.1 alanine racemase [Bradyrhizobium sp. CB1024]
MRGTDIQSGKVAATLAALATPALLLDRDRLDRNLARLSSRMAARGVVLRPHMKTGKSIDVARRVYRSVPGPITVSTLAEAEYFAQHGFRDMTYAVGLAPHTSDRAMRLQKAGIDIKVLLDSPEQAAMLGAAGRAAGVTPSALVEIDCDGHRGGLTATDPKLVVVAAAMAEAGVKIAGVLTHAGESYGLSTPAALVAAAESERAVAVAAAMTLRAAGHECRVVSVGSTPTAHFADDLTGVTEMRAGVYMFFDLVMHGVGVCTTDDIAISVLATVIGKKPEKGWILVDAGWMALSRDRGTAAQPADQGYGLVCDVAGKVFPDLIVSQASQEHGILAVRPGSAHALPDLPIGAKVRILPNHACATASQHELYNVVSADSEAIEARWPRMRGW